jgi:hypothetical protein
VMRCVLGCVRCRDTACACRVLGHGGVCTAVHSMEGHGGVCTRALPCTAERHTPCSQARVVVAARLHAVLRGAGGGGGVRACACVVRRSSSSRVACVVRAIMMKKVKDECLAEHALSQTVLEAADLVNAGVLALQVKAALKEKMKVMRGRSWRKSSAGALDFDV